MRTAIAALAALALAGCASTPQQDVTGWDPSDDRVSTVPCEDLLEDWAPGAADAPTECWSYDETDGLEDSFLAFTRSLSDHLGAEPTRGPECMESSATYRSMSCHAEWADGDPVVVLSSGVTLHALEDAVANDTSYSDPEQPVLHELVLSESEEPLGDDGPGVGFRPVGP